MATAALGVSYLDPEDQTGLASQPKSNIISVGSLGDNDGKRNIQLSKSDAHLGAKLNWTNDQESPDFE